MDDLGVILYFAFNFVDFKWSWCTVYGVKWHVLLLIGCYCSDTNDLVLSSGQAVGPSSADQNRVISSIKISKLH